MTTHRTATRHLAARPAASFVLATLPLAVAGLLLAAPGAAQDERFVGIWQKDYTRSDAPTGRQDRPQPNAPDIEIEFQLTDQEVLVTQSTRRLDWPTPQHVDVTWVTNNKPHAARDPNSGAIQEVRVKWRKKKLNVSFTVKIATFEADVQQTWEITKQGDLLQTTVGRGAEGRPDIRRNYFVRATTVQ